MEGGGHWVRQLSVDAGGIDPFVGWLVTTGFFGSQ